MDQYFSSDVIWTESVFDVHYISGNVNDIKNRKFILFRQMSIKARGNLFESTQMLIYTNRIWELLLL